MAISYRDPATGRTRTASSWDEVERAVTGRSSTTSTASTASRSTTGGPTGSTRTGDDDDFDFSQQVRQQQLAAAALQRARTGPQAALPAGGGSSGGNQQQGGVRTSGTPQIGDVIRIRNVTIRVTGIDPRTGNVQGTDVARRPGDPNYVRQFTPPDLVLSGYDAPQPQVQPPPGAGFPITSPGAVILSGREREAQDIIDQYRRREISLTDAIRDLTPLTGAGTRDAALEFFDASLGRDTRLDTGLDTDTPGGPLAGLPRFDPLFQNFLDQELREQAVGTRGVFRQLTDPLLRGQSPLLRQAVERQFDPLFASFVTDPARLNEIRFTRQPTFEEHLRSQPQIASPQEIIRRLVSIGEMAESPADRAQESFVEPFLNPNVAQSFFTQAATRQLNPFFRSAAQDVLDREFERILFQQPGTPLIRQIASRRGQLF